MREHVELAYATTVHGAQGETVDHAHLLVGETTGAAAAYVGMTRGRHRNTAHLVADTLDEAREQWVEVFGRDRADLGPAHAAERRGRGHRPLRTRKRPHATHRAAGRRAAPPRAAEPRHPADPHAAPRRRPASASDRRRVLNVPLA